MVVKINLKKLRYIYMEFSYTQEEGTQGVAIFFIFLKK